MKHWGREGDIERHGMEKSKEAEGEIGTEKETLMHIGMMIYDSFEIFKRRSSRSKL